VEDSPLNPSNHQKSSLYYIRSRTELPLVLLHNDWPVPRSSLTAVSRSLSHTDRPNLLRLGLTLSPAIVVYFLANTEWAAVWKLDGQRDETVVLLDVPFEDVGARSQHPLEPGAV